MRVEIIIAKDAGDDVPTKALAVVHQNGLSAVIAETPIPFSHGQKPCDEFVATTCERAAAWLRRGETNLRSLGKKARFVSRV